MRFQAAMKSGNELVADISVLLSLSTSWLMFVPALDDPGQGCYGYSHFFPS